MLITFLFFISINLTVPLQQNSFFLLIFLFFRFAKVYFYLFQSIKNKYLPLFCFFYRRVPKECAKVAEFLCVLCVESLRPLRLKNQKLEFRNSHDFFNTREHENIMRLFNVCTQKKLVALLVSKLLIKVKENTVVFGSLNEPIE